MKRGLVILLGTLVVAASAQATTYVRVEPDGSKTYSDRPLPGGHPVDIQPAQTYSAPATPDPPDTSRSPEQREVLSAANFQYSCALSPRNDETFQNPETVTLSVQLTPSLRPGDHVEFSLDGSSLPNSANGPSTTLQFPDRGSHTAAVQVVDRSGKKICDASTRFHVQRTGLNSPANRPPPKPPKPTPHPKGGG